MAKDTGKRGEEDNWDAEPSLAAEELAATYHFETPAASGVEKEAAAVAKVEKAFSGLAPVAMELDLDQLPTDFDELYSSSIDLAEVTGDFELVPKAALIGVPFVIVGVNLNETDLTLDGYYANVRVVTADKLRLCFNDGGTGVYHQLKEILNKQPEPRPIRCKGGLRVSTYHINGQGEITKDGVPNQATYYLSSSLSDAEKSRIALSALGK